MHAIARALRTQWLGALGLVVGMAGAAMGATGQPALLGRLNQADRPTVLANNSGGPAAAFNVKAGEVPFTVSSSRQIPNLNASRLGGKLPSAYAAVGSTYTKAQSDARYAAATSVYTKATSDGRYAPASGSPNYLPSTEPRLLDMQYFTEPARYVDFYDETVVAPGSGRLVVQVIGVCTLVNGEALSLAVGLDADGQGVDYGVGPANDRVACAVTADKAVTDGQSVAVRAAWSTNTVVTAKLSLATVTVSFVPQ